MKKQIIGFLLLFIIGSVAFGQTAVMKFQQQYYLKAEIVVNADSGWPSRVLITGKADQDVAWLGISLYPYGVTDAITGGTHSFVEVKKGEFSQEILIPTEFLGGSFEVGLWRTKVDKVDSNDEYNYWDKMFGFHVEDLVVYKSGLLTQLNGYSD